MSKTPWTLYHELPEHKGSCAEYRAHHDRECPCSTWNRTNQGNTTKVKHHVGSCASDGMDWWCLPGCPVREAHEE